MKPTKMLKWVVLASGGTLVACGGVSAIGSGEGGPGRGQSGSTGSGGRGQSGSTGSGGMACVSEGPPDVPMRLLNDYELDRELERFGEPLDQFPPTLNQSRLFIEDPPTPASALFVEAAWRFAEQTALKLSSDSPRLAELTGCDAAIDGEEPCREALIRFVTAHLFRGLASPETPAELDQVFDMGQELGGDYASGVRAVLEVALQSPELHYRIELGRPAAGKPEGWAEATDFEMASRLSFLLWDRGPDDELLSAAEQGELTDAAAIEGQARRLLADERARQPVRRFYRELMRVSQRYDVRPELAPDFTAAIGVFVQHELDGFVDEATFGARGDFRALFRPVTWLNGPLAAFYGVPGVSGDGFAAVELDSRRYAGLLTLPAWLNRSPTLHTSPSMRGALVSQALLCLPIPPESAEVAGSIKPPSFPPGPLTTRQRFEIHTADPVCVSCHELMDPLGFALEHFDAAGRYRETEEGLPIDASGEILRSDAAGPFVGAVELAGRIADSQDARRCFVSNWARFAYGKREAEANPCAQQALAQRFAESNDSVVELLVALTQTDSFRYLTPRQVEP